MTDFKPIVDPVIFGYLKDKKFQSFEKVIVAEAAKEVAPTKIAEKPANPPAETQTKK